MAKPKSSHTKSTDELVSELRFMSQAYRIVVAQRDRAIASEKELVTRIKNLKATLRSFGVTGHG